MASDEVRAQYEQFPYPLRRPDAPAHAADRFGLLDNLRVANHFGFGGRRDFSKPLRILVAGGGTGDASTHLAQQLRNEGLDGEVVYIDISRASREVAMQRATHAGLDNVTFVQGSLLDLPTMGVGPFDYINCAGVLHHLVDPAAGVAALAQVLADDGCMGIMLYGELGRVGVYHAQEMLRIIGKGRSDGDKLALAKQLLPRLPESCWLNKNVEMRFVDTLDDPEIVDRFLHPCDQAFRVPSVVALMAQAGLRVTEFVPTRLFEPATWFDDPQILEQLAALPRWERHAFTELACGVISRLSFFAVPEASEHACARIAPDAVPILLSTSGEALAAAIRRDGMLKLSLGSIVFRMRIGLVPPIDGILAAIDGRRSLGDIHRQFSAALPTWEAFLEEFAPLYQLLNGAAALVLARPRPQSSDT